MGKELPDELWVVCCPIHITRASLSRANAEHEVMHDHDPRCHSDPDFKVYKVKLTSLEAYTYVKPITPSPLQPDPLDYDPNF